MKPTPKIYGTFKQASHMTEMKVVRKLGHAGGEIQKPSFLPCFLYPWSTARGGCHGSCGGRGGAGSGRWQKKSRNRFSQFFFKTLQGGIRDKGSWMDGVNNRPQPES